MIRLSLLDGAPVLVNPKAVYGIIPAADGTLITSAAGDQIVVKQSLKEVEKRIASTAPGDRTMTAGPASGASLQR